MEQDPAAFHLVREVRTALRRDTGVRDANALHGAVTQVWFDQYEAREAVRAWHRLVFADATVLEDEAVAPRRTERAGWWSAVERAARQFLRLHPTGLAPLVVHTGAKGSPARVAFASRDDWPEVTLRVLHREGPLIDRLTLLLTEVESLQTVIAEGSSFGLGDVAEALRSVIDIGEPAVRGPLPDRPEAALAGSAGPEEAAASEEDLRAARQRLDELLSQHDATSHPEVIAQWIVVADLTGRCGDARAAITLFEHLGKELRELLGPHHTRTLDAYEGIARWVGRRGRA
ncbi:hypothetical protein AB0A60_20025 [Streptomyces sp. NPDC046275]|uniref:hypothetical protein n=1 Tax=Streptomyces sp. NPDC046275 TaxID=3157201 RepID=UPI0033E50B00